MKNKIKNLTGLCPCGSTREIKKCCLPLIQGDEIALTVEQLMRSRYTAYALREPEYIVNTWHVDTRPNDLVLEKSTIWSGLKILKASNRTANTAWVEFIAYFENNRVPGQMHERSRFLYLTDRWFYIDGEQIESDTQHKLKLPGRNDPCHCGSGRKYKKCCA
jgi:SEC-C motif-containing protein